MRPALTSLGRRLPELGSELTAIADGYERNDVRMIERARTVADHAVHALCEETGVPATDSVTNLIDALLAKHAMPHTIAAHLRVLYDPESTLVGDAARALIAFLEWRVGSRSRMSAMPARRSMRLPLTLGAAICVVGVAIAIVLVRRDELPAKQIVSGAMIRIAGATTEMGSTEAELAAAFAYCRDIDHGGALCAEVRSSVTVEEVRRTATVAAFELDRREVTIGEFVTWLASHPQVDRGFANIRFDGETYAAAPGREQVPIAGVTWADARGYCEAVGKRLPSEAEWELAARGTTRRLYPWGDEAPQCTTAVYARAIDRACSLGSPGDAAPVESAVGDITPEGVRDLGGNVAEWTADAGGGLTRMVRGGHWASYGGELRAAIRSAIDPAAAWTHLGFRCAR